MKNIFYLLSSFIAFVFLVSCSNSVNSSLPPSQRLQGLWIIVEAEGSMAELNHGTTYLWEGTTMTTSKNDFEVTGEYSATDSTITWKAGTIEMNYNYHFEENDLIIELGLDQKFVLNK